MSGVKYSQIKLEQERKACQEALNSISALTGSIEGLKEKTRAILNQLPEGVKETFSGEIQRAKYWESKDIPIPSKEMNSTQLNKVAERLKEMNKAGREMLHLLIELKEVRRDEKARELIEKLEGLMAEIGGMKLLLNKWRQERYKELTKTLDGLSPMIEAGEFVKVGRGLSESERTLNELKTLVGSLEAQDNQRRYVLCSLRNVCKEWR